MADFPDLTARLRIVGRAYGLNALEQRIWLVSLLRETQMTFRDALCLVNEAPRRQYLLNLAKMFGIPGSRILATMNPQSPLFTLELLNWHLARGCGAYLNFRVEQLQEAFLAPDFSPEKLLCGAIIPAPRSNLHLSDYPMLQEELAMIVPYLKAAVRENRPGVNLLCHGAPGVGKTELSRLLAQTINCPAYEVAYAEGREGRSEPSAKERMGFLTKALTLVRNQRAMLIFDEAEDLFRGSLFSRSFAQERKGQFNHLLTTNTKPIIWISNHIRSMDPAFLRRFDFVLEFSPPNRTQRKKIFSKVGQNILDEPLLEELAGFPELAPAVVERACRVVASLPSAKDDSSNQQKAVRRILRNTLKAQGNPAWQKVGKPARPETSTFRTQYLNTDVDLEDLAGSLAKRPEARLCLFGPPGTGKTSFGHFLSRTIERPLLIKRASDLISPYHGQTERHLADAFAEAEREDSILLIDEVDSFLRDRRGAVRSWEVTEVNEFLTQMESFAGLFIASTNLVDDLDPAAARRFDFKVCFNYLRPDQAEALFHEQITRLGIVADGLCIPGGCTDLEMLTPGDFANLARQHQLRPFSSPEAYLDALHREVNMKSETHHRRIGFA